MTVSTTFGSDKSANFTVSGGLTVTTNNNATAVGRADYQSGNQDVLYYLEVKLDGSAAFGNDQAFGLANSTFVVSTAQMVGNDTNSIGLWFDDAGAGTTAQVVYNSGGTAQRLAAWPTKVNVNDVVGMAWNPAKKLLWFRINNGLWNNLFYADPATGQGGVNFSSLVSGTPIVAASLQSTGDQMTVRFSSSSWTLNAVTGAREYGTTTYNDSVSETAATADTLNATSRPQFPFQPNAFGLYPQATGGGGGTTYNDSVSESIATADTVSAVLTAVGSVSETAATADTVSATIVTATMAISETAATSETVTGTIVTTAMSVGESVATADTVSGALVMPGSLSESIATSDTVSAVLVAVGSVSETAAAADTVTATLDAVGSIAETVSTADAVTGTIVTATMAVAESAAITDTVTGGSLYNDSVSESIATADTVSATLVAVGAVSESAAVADTVSATLVAVGAIAETVSTADAVTGLLVTVTMPVSESVGIADTTDGTTGGSVYNESISESVSITDTVDAPDTGSGIDTHDGPDIREAARKYRKKIEDEDKRRARRIEEAAEEARELRASLLGEEPEPPAEAAEEARESLISPKAIAEAKALISASLKGADEPLLDMPAEVRALEALLAEDTATEDDDEEVLGAFLMLLEDA